jgi:hypothetical protein
MSADKNLETVYVASGQWEAQVVKARLEDAGIPVLLSYESVGPVVGVTVDGLGEVKVMVPHPVASQARAVLRETPGTPP